MEKVEKLRGRLVSIRMVLTADEGDIEKILNEVLEAMKDIGLNPEKRAEGYAFPPSHEAAVIGLPHLRLARRGDLLTVWVRAPHGLEERRCRIVGLSVDGLYQKLVEGAERIAEIFRKYSKESEFIHISLP